MLQRLKVGYAHLLDAPLSTFDRSGFMLIETDIRDEPEWASWIQPIWLFSMGSTVICSVSPQYTAQAEVMLKGVLPGGLLDGSVLHKASSIIADKEWVQCELFFYPLLHPPQTSFHYIVEALQPGEEGAEKLLRNFDGGVYVIRNSTGQIASHAAVKNKGLIREIAVGTQPYYRGQGMGRTVVAHAIREILAIGCVPTYWPDSLENIASYALAQSIGFVKVAQMLFCAYERPGWPGFLIAATKNSHLVNY